jgi:hypothetical protein
MRHAVSDEGQILPTPTLVVLSTIHKGTIGARTHDKIMGMLGMEDLSTSLTDC